MENGGGSRYAVILLASVGLRVSGSHGLDEITCEVLYDSIILFYLDIYNS